MSVYETDTIQDVHISLPTPGDNLDGNPELFIRADEGSGFTRKTFIDFDINSNIQSNKVVVSAVFTYEVTNTFDVDITVNPVDTTWDATLLTWNTAEVSPILIIGAESNTLVVGGMGLGDFSTDITAVIQAVVTRSGFGIRLTKAGTAVGRIASMEHATATKPHIKVTLEDSILTILPNIPNMDSIPLINRS